MTKLKQIVEKSNQNADFTANYQKNIALKKKLFNIGSPIAIISFLISMFVLLVVFSIAFGFGLYILKQASSLHLSKQIEENNKKEESNQENIENKK